MKIKDFISISRGINKTRDLNESMQDSLLDVAHCFDENQIIKDSLSFNNNKEESFSSAKNYSYIRSKSSLYSLSQSLVVSLTRPNHNNQNINPKHMLQNNDIIIPISRQEVYLYRGENNVYCVDQNHFILRLQNKYVNKADELVFALMYSLFDAMLRSLSRQTLVRRLDIKKLGDSNLPDTNYLIKINNICRVIFELQMLYRINNTLEKQLISGTILQVLRGDYE